MPLTINWSRVCLVLDSQYTVCTCSFSLLYLVTNSIVLFQAPLRPLVVPATEARRQLNRILQPAIRVYHVREFSNILCCEKDVSAPAKKIGKGSCFNLLSLNSLAQFIIH